MDHVISRILSNISFAALCIISWKMITLFQCTNDFFLFFRNHTNRLSTTLAPDNNSTATITPSSATRFWVRSISLVSFARLQLQWFSSLCSVAWHVCCVTFSQKLYYNYPLSGHIPYYLWETFRDFQESFRSLSVVFQDSFRSLLGVS